MTLCLSINPIPPHDENLVPLSLSNDDGKALAVGSSNGDNNGNGYARVYDLSGDCTTLIQRGNDLVSNVDKLPNAIFGVAVSLSNDESIVAFANLIKAMFLIGMVQPGIRLVIPCLLLLILFL